MKKKCVALVSVFLVFLAAGGYYNLRKGQYMLDTFWRLDASGVYVSPAGDTIFCQAEGDFSLCLAGRTLSAQLSALPDGGYRVDFSDGWAVEWTDALGPAVQIGGTTFSWGETDVLTDMGLAGLEFAALAQTERIPFVDENQQPAGEIVYLYAEGGELLHTQEIFYHDSASAVAPESIVLRDGVRLSDDMRNGSALYQNEDGEYLLHADELTLVTLSDAKVSRGVLARLIQSVAQQPPETRGSPAVLALYVLLYAIGALSFLFPEQAAFFGTRWKYQTAPELSDMGLLAMQAGSVLCLILAIALLFIPLA